MNNLVLMAGLALVAGMPPGAGVWQECQVETATLCDLRGCRNVEPTLKLFFGDYSDAKGRPRGYYKRCRRGGSCDFIENPWIGENDNYRAFVVPERGVSARIGADGKVTDVATLNNDVLISRGSCWSAKPQRHPASGPKR